MSEPLLTVPTGTHFEELYAARVSLQLSAKLLALKAEVLLEVGFTRIEVMTLLTEKLI